MFHCQVCSTLVGASVPCNKRILKKRVKHYPYRPAAKQEWRLDKKGQWKWTWIDDPGGVGYEATGEVKCCPSCALKVDKNEIHF